MDIFCLPKTAYDIKPNHAANLYLPTDISAPKWDENKCILQIIANTASEQANIWLISGRTRTTPNKFRERTWCIMCEYGRTYYTLKNLPKIVKVYCNSNQCQPQVCLYQYRMTRLGEIEW